MHRHLRIVLASVFSAALSQSVSAQSLPSECAPGEAVDGGSAICELAAPGILDSIFTTANDFSLTIGSTAVPTTIQSGGVGFDDLAVELTGGGDQTLNLLGADSVIEGLGSAGGVRIESSAGSALRLLSEGTIIGGPDFGAGIELFFQGDSVDVDLVDLISGGTGLNLATNAQDVAITSTGQIESGIAGINVFAGGAQTLDIDVASITSDSSAVSVNAFGNVELDVTGQVTNSGNLSAITIFNGGAAVLSTHDIDTAQQALDISSNAGVNAVIDGDVTSQLAGGRGAIEIFNEIAGDVDLTVTGEIVRPIGGELTPGIVNIIQDTEAGAVTLDLGAVTSSGGVGTDNRDLVFVDVTAAQAGDVTVLARGPLTHTGDATVDGVEINTAASGNINVDLQDISASDTAIRINVAPADGPFGATNVSAGHLTGNFGIAFERFTLGGAVNFSVDSIDFNAFGAQLTFSNTQGGDSSFTSTGAITAATSGISGVSLSALNTGGDIVIDVNDITARNAINAVVNADALRITTRGLVSATDGGGFGALAGINATNNGGALTVDVLAESVVERFADGTAIQLNAADTNFTAILTNAGTIRSPNAAIVDLAGNSRIVNSGFISGSIELGGGTNEINNLVGGLIETGLVTGDNILFDNAGVLSVGDTGVEASSSVVTVDGFNQSAEGSLLFEIDSTGTHDTLLIDGDVDLDGVLQLSIDPTLDIAAGTTFDLLTSTSELTLNPNLAFEALFQELDVNGELLPLRDVTSSFSLTATDPFTLTATAISNVSAVPEPGSLWLLATGGLSLLCVRRKR